MGWGLDWGLDPILLGLDRQIQARGGDLAIPLEQFWIYWVWRIPSIWCNIAPVVMADLT